MAQDVSEDAALLLKSAVAGDEDATGRLIEAFYPQLQQAAGGMLRDERNVSLASGDLVHEVVIRLIRLDQIEWQNKAHFMALASKLMRHVLIDHVRAKRADKRAHMRVTLATYIEMNRRFDLFSLDHALIRLGAIDQQGADIVEMRYFGGMSIADVAEATGLSEPTVKRRWSAARIWLIDAMESDGG